MARAKGSKNKKEEIVIAPEIVIPMTEVVEILVVPNPILPLSVDYPSEGLNNMAKKINEIIERINATA